MSKTRLHHTLTQNNFYIFVNFFIFIHFHFIVYYRLCRDGIYFDKLLINPTLNKDYYYYYCTLSCCLCLRNVHSSLPLWFFSKRLQLTLTLHLSITSYRDIDRQQSNNTWEISSKVQLIHILFNWLSSSLGNI